jgi:hypothetical protein
MFVLMALKECLYVSDGGLLSNFLVAGFVIIIF